MAKNEAKIKFTAETGEFNSAIKKANGEMSELRAELKLNETQMKATGATVEGLEKKHSILAQQLSASEDKTEALSQKVQKAVEIFGANSEEASKLKVQLLNAQTAEEKLRQAVAQCVDELNNLKNASEEAEAATEDNRTAAEKLSDTIKEQQTELDQLKKKYADLVVEQKDGTDEARELAEQIEKLSGELKESKSAFDGAADKADKLDKSMADAGDSASESADGFTIAKGAIADLAADAIQAAIGKVSEFIDYLAELPEATRELRQDMATLETSFARAGLTTEQATDTWKELYKVFGEDDRAVEAANMIAKMSDNQQDLNDWVTITQGIWGTYQDSLPVEGLAEASNETAKTGQVTGVLADALNWSSEAASMFAGYMSEDVTTAEDAFNEALKECTTEEERQALITETLTALYGDAAAEYEKASGAQIAAKEATAENTLIQNELAEALEPATTAWQNMKNELLSGVAPVIKSISEFLADHPVLLKVIAGVVAVLTTAISGLAIGLGIYTAAQWAANSALWAAFAPVLPVILAVTAAIAAVVAIVIVCIEYWDEIVAAVKNCWTAVCDAIGSAWEWIKGVFSTVCEWINTNVIQPVADFFSGLWNGIVSVFNTCWNAIVGFFSSIANWIYTNVVLPISTFFTNLWNGIVNAFHTVIDPWIEIVKRIATIIYESVILPVKNFFTDLWNSIVSGVQGAWNWCVNLAMTVANWVNMNVIQPVVNFFTGLWNKITSGVQSAVNGVKNVFSTIANWVNNTVIQPVKNFFSNLWNGFKNGAVNAWNGVKSVFSKVGQFFSGIFNTVKEKILSVFSAGGKIFNGIKEGIVNVFKTVVNGIIKGINTVIALPFKGLNGILDTIHGVEIVGVKPFSWLTWRAPVPQIPLLAEGGIVDRATLNIAGEAGPEAIIPIDKLQTYVADAVNRAIQAVNIQALVWAIEDLANRPISLNINGRQFAHATASDGDSVNGLRSTFKSRGLELD